jgi:hypothetical protein
MTTRATGIVGAAAGCGVQVHGRHRRSIAASSSAPDLVPPAARPAALSRSGTGRRPDVAGRVPTPPLFKHAQNRSDQPRRLAARSGLTAVLVSAVAAASAVTCTGAANAQAATATVTLKSTGDAYVSASAPSSNYGKDHSLRITSKTGQTKTSYLAFTVPATPGKTVTKAELVVHRTGHHLPATKLSALKMVGYKENESSLTAANAPKGGTVVATATTSTTTQSVSFNVSSAVKHSGSVVFALTSPVTTDVLQFASREAGATGPQLVLTTTATASSPAKCSVSTKLVSSCGRWLGIAAQAYSGETGPTALVHDENFTGSSFARPTNTSPTAPCSRPPRTSPSPSSPDTTGSCSRIGNPPPT